MIKAAYLVAVLVAALAVIFFYREQNPRELSDMIKKMNQNQEAEGKKEKLEPLAAQIEPKTMEPARKPMFDGMEK